MEKTLGQKRVGAKYNLPIELVDIIKDRSAELIDLLECTREKETSDEKVSGEKHRLISIAQTKIETACMYAVKSCSIK